MKPDTTMIEIIIAAAKAKEADLPNAAPLDLLTKKEYQKVDSILASYGPMRKYIDENYVALLVALSQYEEVDFMEKINAHIVHNIRNA